MSTLTFVVCAYGESPYLRECVHSLLTQSLPCPIVISTSTPNEPIRRAAKDFSLPLFVHDQIPDIAGDWNAAYRSADTEYVVLAHQDDLYEPAYAEIALNALDHAGNPLLFFTDYFELRGDVKTADNRNLRIKRTLLRPLKNPRFASATFIKRKVLSLGNPVCCPSVAYVKANLPETPFRPGMKSNLDWDAWERFSRLSGSFVYVDRPLICHRIHSSSTTSALINAHKRSGEDLSMLKRFWPAPVAAAINRVYKKAEMSNSL